MAGSPPQEEKTAGSFDVSLELQEDYRFLVDFGLEGVEALPTDEPPPIGDGTGPNPTRLLAAGVANCLAASLLFCLRKARVPVDDLHASVSTRMTRNERGRLRVGGFAVSIRPEVPAEAQERMSRCLALFEDFCVVTESVRSGVPVEVSVEVIEAAGG
jgi:uncharacterized OsmC-like protein